MNRSTRDLIAIAAAGGGIKLDALKYSTQDLIAIASAISKKNAKLEIINSKIKTTQDLIAIASAGKGCVFFFEI